MKASTKATLEGASVGAYLAVVALVIMSAMLHGCGASLTRSNQMRVLNIATTAANEAERQIVLAYARGAEKCLGQADNRITFDVCMSELDHEYTKVRLAWEGLRMTQDQYARALESSFYKPEEFLDWFRMSYCNLVADLPFEVRLPPVPGLSCQDRVDNADE